LVGRIGPLGNDALKPKPAGGPVKGLAVAHNMLAELDRACSLMSDERSKLPAPLDLRQVAQIRNNPSTMVFVSFTFVRRRLFVLYSTYRRITAEFKHFMRRVSAACGRMRGLHRRFS
jgi:hypothetical protein